MNLNINPDSLLNDSVGRSFILDDRKLRLYGRDFFWLGTVDNASQYVGYVRSTKEYDALGNGLAIMPTRKDLVDMIKSGCYTID